MAKTSKTRVKFSLRAKIIWLILILIAFIMILMYRSILKDERKSLTAQMQAGGGAVATLLANNSQVALANALSAVSLGGPITQSTYEKISYFDLGFSDTLDKIIQQKDIIYAVIVNKFDRVVGHSRTDKDIPENSLYKPIGTVQLYKDLYKDGTPLKPINQDYKGKFYNPKSGKYEEGEILDISFPLVVDLNVTSLKAYEGEVHIGLSKKSIYKAIRSAEAKLQQVSLLAFIIGVIGALILAGIIIGPINKLVLAMGLVAEGNLKQKVKVRTGDEIQLLANSFNSMTDGLAKYVSPGLVKKLMKNPSSLALGGGYKRMTMLFCDIRNFTGTSEKMQPDEVVQFLNEYLDDMTKVVLKYGGDIDKYVGDEIMALYGIFDDDEANLADYAKQAVRTAVGMNQALIAFDERQEARGRVQIRMGTGINTGDVILGNMGSTERMDYTVIGDNVNLAARLCDNAGKDYKEDNGNIVHLRNILITEDTYELVKDIVAVDDKVIFIRVKGKEKPIKIYQVYDVKE